MRGAAALFEKAGRRGAVRSGEGDRGAGRRNGAAESPEDAIEGQAPEIVVSEVFRVAGGGEEDAAVPFLLNPGQGLGAVVAAVLGVDGVAGEDGAAGPLQRIDAVEPTGQREIGTHAVEDVMVRRLFGSGGGEVAVVTGPAGAEGAEREAVVFRLVGVAFGVFEGMSGSPEPGHGAAGFLVGENGLELLLRKFPPPKEENGEISRLEGFEAFDVVVYLGPGAGV